MFGVAHTLNEKQPSYFPDLGFRQQLLAELGLPWNDMTDFIDALSFLAYHHQTYLLPTSAQHPSDASNGLIFELARSARRDYMMRPIHANNCKGMVTFWVRAITQQESLQAIEVNEPTQSRFRLSEPFVRATLRIGAGRRRPCQSVRDMGNAVNLAAFSTRAFRKTSRTWQSQTILGDSRGSSEHRFGRNVTDCQAGKSAFLTSLCRAIEQRVVRV